MFPIRFADLPRKSQYLLSFQATIPSTKVGTLRSLLQSNPPIAEQGASKKSTISQYFSTTNCVCDCGGQTQAGICSKCLRAENRQKSTLIISDKICQLDRKVNLCQEICSSCCGRAFQTKCTSLDCPVLFMLNRWQRDSKQMDYFRQLLAENF